MKVIRFTWFFSTQKLGFIFSTGFRVKGYRRRCRRTKLPRISKCIEEFDDVDDFKMVEDLEEVDNMKTIEDLEEVAAMKMLEYLDEVAAMKMSGAILLCATNVSELGTYFENSFDGSSNNPFR